MGRPPPASHMFRRPPSDPTGSGPRASSASRSHVEIPLRTMNARPLPDSNRSRLPRPARPTLGRRAALTVAALLVPALVPAGAEARQVAAQDLVVAGRPSCEACELRIVERLVLGSIDDAASPSGQVQAAVGGEGDIYLISQGLPLPGLLRYAPDGLFQGIFGRPGQGPGEMGLPWRLGGALDGTVHVFDATMSAVHVFSPAGAWERTLRPIVPPMLGPVPVGDSVVAFVPGSTRGPGVPDQDVVLYHAHTGVLLGGAGPIVPFVAGQPPTVSALAEGRDGSMWVARGARGVLERWTVSGQLGSRLRWEDGWARFARADGGRAAYLGAHLWQDPESGLLWVVSNSPSPAAPPPVRVEPGQPLPSGLLDPKSLNSRHSPIVSVVDPAQGRVLAHRVLDHYVHAVLADGRLVVMNESDTGYQWVEVLRLELTGWRERD
jgi:hypothetical protein